jgi:anti-anti-sigma factor
MSAERELLIRSAGLESAQHDGASARSGIVIGRYQRTVVVTVHGDLDHARAAHLGEVLADLIDGQGNLSLLVDLHDATAVDAERLSVFAEAAERVHSHGGAITLSKPPALLLEALRERDLGHLVVAILDQHRAPVGTCFEDTPGGTAASPPGRSHRLVRSVGLHDRAVDRTHAEAERLVSAGPKRLDAKPRSQTGGSC